MSCHECQGPPSTAERVCRSSCTDLVMTVMGALNAVCTALKAAKPPGSKDAVPSLHDPGGGQQRPHGSAVMEGQGATA